jgi:predicted ATPase
LRLSWRQKVSGGFFLRAETFFNFATYLEDVGSPIDPEQLAATGCFAAVIFKSTKPSVAIGCRSVGNIRGFAGC